MKNCIVFDFDGTLWNCAHAYQLALTETLDKFEYSLESSIVGRPVEESLRLNGMVNPEEISSAAQYFRKLFSQYDLEYSSIYNGAKETLSRLVEMEYALFIATFKRQSLLEEVLDKENIGHFFESVTGTEESKEKPSKTYLVAKCLEGSGVVCNSGFLVGDSSKDMVAAYENNLKFIYAKYGFEDLTIGETDSVISSIVSLISVIDC